MARTQAFYSRVEPDLKAKADAIFARLGMSSSDAVNIFFNQSLMEKGLPFAMSLPRYNEETLEAMAEGKQLAKDILAGKRKPYDNVEDMLRDLKAGV